MKDNILRSAQHFCLCSNLPIVMVNYHNWQSAPDGKICPNYFDIASHSGYTSVLERYPNLVWL
uniref:Uncharacterized protein n=1 Tax=candidate division WOR-3 bacterium TaxID=2052148 RepID=A0A7C6A867_UNCW3